MNSQTSLLFYLFIAIFSVTAIITLLGITGVLKGIKDKYLNALFGALILEVVSAVVLSYKQIDLGDQSPELINHLIELLEEDKEDSFDKNVDELKHRISDYTNIKTNHDSLVLVVSKLEEQLLQLGEEHEHSDKEFLMHIITLREITRKEMDGTSINLVFNRQEKTKVFNTLEQIFMSLGKIDPTQEMTPVYLTNVYIKFLTTYGLKEKLVSVNESGTYTGVYLTDYVTSLMVRAYLEKFYPV